MRRPVQGELFGAPAPQATDLVQIEAGGASLSPLQREFNRLSAQIGKLRGELADWEEFDHQIHAQLSAAEPVIEAATEAAQREMLDTLHTLLATPQRPALSKRARQVMTETLLDRVRELIERFPAEPDLVTTHDFHSPQAWANWQAESQLAREAELSHVRQQVAAAFGETAEEPASGESTAEWVESLETKVRTQWEQDAAEREQRRQDRADARRAASAQTAKAQTEQAQQQSVRAIYRQLASALHPDREPDPVLRAHKTELMQRINAAYAAADLLGLLALQMEVAQLDEAGLSALPDQRLMHYIGVLKTQARTLKAELQSLIEQLRMSTGLLRLNTLKQFKAGFAEHLEERHAHYRRLRERCQMLRDPRMRATAIQYLQMEAEARDFHAHMQQLKAEEDLELLKAFASFQQQRATRQPRRRR